MTKASKKLITRRSPRPLNMEIMPDDKTFADKVSEAQDSPIVVIFGSTSWDPCDKMFPFFQTQATDNQDVWFLYVDVEKCPETNFSYKIRYLPEFVFRMNQYEVDRSNARETVTLQNYIDQIQTTPVYDAKPRINAMKSATSDEDFAAQLEKAENNLVVIYFTAKWSFSCSTMSKHVQQQAKANPNVLFLEVDVDSCKQIAADYRIRAVPTVILRKYKIGVDTIKGIQPDKLMKGVTKHRTPTSESIKENTEICVANDADFLDKINDAQHRLVVIYFIDALCDYCKEIIPLVPGLLNKFQVIRFLKVSKQNCPRTLANYKIRSVPTFVFQKNDVEIVRREEL